jgi:hypothetical protein
MPISVSSQELAAIIVDSLQTDTNTIATAAPRKLGLVRRIIRGFDKVDERYIEPQHYVFAAMLQSTRNYDFYTLRSVGPNRQSISFSPDSEVRIGPYAGWKWVFLGYTFSLKNIDFGSDRRGLDLSVYSSQIGIDLFYHRTGHDYKLRDVNLGRKLDYSALNDLPFDGLTSGITGFNIYYIFNHGRFSYPAAFSQSTIQKISCGSWLAGFGYTRNSIEFNHDQLQNLIDEHMGANVVQLDSALMFQNVNYVDFSLSAGYAYNWVFAPNWLLGSSIQAAVAHKRSTGEMSDTKSGGFSFRNLNIDGIGRFALVYNNMKWYAGASVILHTYNYYHKSRFSSNNTFGSMNVYVGFNFGLKKKYRKKTDE